MTRADWGRLGQTGLHWRSMGAVLPMPALMKLRQHWVRCLSQSRFWPLPKWKACAFPPRGWRRARWRELLTSRQFDRVVRVPACALLPLAAVSTLFGAWIIKRMRAELFYPLMYGMIALVGVKMVWDAVGALVG